MELNEHLEQQILSARNQIAINYGHKDYGALFACVGDQLIYVYEAEAFELLIQLQDKEIERLEILSKRNTDEYQKVVDEKVKEIAELKEKCVSFQNEIFELINNPNSKSHEQ